MMHRLIFFLAVYIYKFISQKPFFFILVFVVVFFFFWLIHITPTDAFCNYMTMFYFQFIESLCNQKKNV